MEKEVIVQIYRRIYSIEKENNFESVYKYQDIITGIEVTLENGNKVFKDNNNNIVIAMGGVVAVIAVGALIVFKVKKKSIIVQLIHILIMYLIQ